MREYICYECGARRRNANPYGAVLCEGCGTHCTEVETRVIEAERVSYALFPMGLEAEPPRQERCVVCLTSRPAVGRSTCAGCGGSER